MTMTKGAYFSLMFWVVIVAVVVDGVAALVLHVG